MKKVLPLLLVLIAGSGCSSEESESAEPTPPTVPTGLEAGWNEIPTGGETICSRGTEYAFFVRPGTVNRVVIDFIGGGACWDDLTCGLATAIFNPDIENIRDAIAQNDMSGIYDKERSDNPFKDWYHVVIPYCTGDVHWGDNVATYDGAEPVVIHHKGAVNSRAVLDWVYQSFSRPEQILVTGCSAGSYGSIMWSAHVAEHYPSSRVIQFGDSGAGVITEDFFQNSFPSWNAESSFPSWISDLDPAKVDLLALHLADLYVGVTNYYPAQQFSQYNTAFDENQTFYYNAMGGSGADAWSTEMLASIDEIHSRAPTFSSFIASGEQHCILPYDNFYTVNVGGRKLVDWLGDMVAGESVESVACSGDCSSPTP